MGGWQNGCTPLFRAAASGQTEVMGALLAHRDVAVNAGSKDGCSPLYAAVFHQQVCVLPQSGCCVNPSQVLCVNLSRVLCVNPSQVLC